MDDQSGTGFSIVPVSRSLAALETQKTPGQCPGVSHVPSPILCYQV